MNDKARNGEMAALAPYLEAARGLAPLSPEAQRALATRARRGDAAARDELVRRHLPLVVAFARKQRRGTIRLEELVQEGNLGLLRAVEKYDPDAGTRFSTYAIWWIRAYVWKHLKLARSAVRPKSGTPSRADFSLDSPIGDDTSASHLERLEDEAPSPDSRYEAAEGDARVRAALEKVRGRIGALGWEVVQSRLKKDPPDTLEQIGRRFGVSRERVRQVEHATKRFLRGYLQPVEEARRAA